MNDENIQLLERILRRGNPILFTGAGFDFGATRGQGKSIPMGDELKKHIIRDIMGYAKGSDGFLELMNSPLMDVCDVCEGHASAQLKDYLTDTFSGCQPVDCHQIIAKFPWKKIYTTNIDDLLENTFPAGAMVVQNMKRPKSTPTDGKMEYIKLHGCVRNQSEPYVFSAKAYVDSMLGSTDYRFNQFGMDIQYNDFIFIGTKYEEINLDYYLQMYENSISKSGKGNLIFINPSAGIVFRNKLEHYGAKLINWKTEDFAKFLVDNEFVRDTKSQAVRLNNFFVLNDHIETLKATAAYRSNLYQGYDPIWLDIIRDWDFQNKQVQFHFKMFCDDMLRYHKKRAVFSVIGKAMSGKSTYLKRLGYQMYQDGFLVLEYTGKKFDHFSVIRYCRLNKIDRLCLLVDNGSFYYGAFRSLLLNIPAGVELVILTTSRPYFHSRKLYNIVTENYDEFFIPVGIDDDFASEIAAKIDKNGYLGSLKKYADVKDRERQIVRHNDIPSLLYSITYGTGFIKKFRADLQQQLPDMSVEGRNLLHILSIFEKLELPYFPLELATILLGNATKATLSEIDDFVKYDHSLGIALRNGNIANVILTKREPKKILTRIKEILINISPQVYEGNHTYWNEIEATLMKERLLRYKLKLKTPAIRNMLFSIQDYYRDSYNYWIQIGISEQIENEFDKALNHFNQAEAINPNSYMVKNAIARNFLRQANFMESYDSALPYFERGRDLMMQLIAEREEFQVKAYSTHCFLYEKMNFCLKFKLTPTVDELNEMNDMLRSIINKTSKEDGMSKHILNKFYNFVKHYNKTQIFREQMKDLSELGMLLESSGVDIETLFEDFEIEE